MFQQPFNFPKDKGIYFLNKEKKELTVIVQGRLVFRVVCAQLDQVVRMNLHRGALGAGSTEPLAIEERARRGAKITEVIL